MTASGLLTQLRNLGVELSATGDRLRYKAPAGVMTPALFSEVSRQKVELLAFLSAADEEADSMIPLKPVDRTGYLPLSFSQEQMWFLDQLAPGNPYYNITAALRLKGELNEEALRNSLQAILDRHEILRTTFPVVDSKPVQSVCEKATLDLQIDDLTGMEEQQREAKAKQIARQEARRGFDLARGPVMRARLVRVRQQERVMILSLHHIVADGWSMKIVMRELGELYEAEVEGREAKLEELAIQYGDYAVWQRERLKAGGYEEELRYWSEKLEGAEVTEIEADRARPGESRHEGRRVRAKLSERLRGEIREVSRREAVTENVMMMAGLKAMLSRESGQEEVTIGVMAANRGQWELGASIGMYANVVMMRSDLRGNPRMKEVVEGVRKEMIEALGHQEVGYEKVVEEVRRSRERSREERIGVMYVMKEEEEEIREMGGVKVEEEEVEEGISKYDVKVEVKARRGGLEVEIEYDEEVYEEGRMKRMMREYERVMEVIVREPDRRLWDLPKLTSHREMCEEE